MAIHLRSEKYYSKHCNVPMVLLLQVGVQEQQPEYRMHYRLSDREKCKKRG
uniref:Uncharacterized protein n=1 Tax=Heterorhabditis bacteriophora TaxID=37862 RepID=A0A1I7X5Q1_HETBA